MALPRPLDAATRLYAFCRSTGRYANGLIRSGLNAARLPLLMTDRQAITPGLVGVGHTCRSPAGRDLLAVSAVLAAVCVDEADADGDTARPTSPATTRVRAPASCCLLRLTRMYATPISR